MGAQLATCLSKWENFHLAYEHYVDQQKEEAEQAMVTYYWFGLHDSNGNYGYAWLDGSEADLDEVQWDASYRPPGHGRSPGECAYFKVGGARTYGCWDKMNYICKKGGNTC